MSTTTTKKAITCLSVSSVYAVRLGCRGNRIGNSSVWDAYHDLQVEASMTYRSNDGKEVVVQQHSSGDKTTYQATISNTSNESYHFADSSSWCVMKKDNNEFTSSLKYCSELVGEYAPLTVSFTNSDSETKFAWHRTVTSFSWKPLNSFVEKASQQEGGSCAIESAATQVLSLVFGKVNEEDQELYVRVRQVLVQIAIQAFGNHGAFTHLVSAFLLFYLHDRGVAMPIENLQFHVHDFTKQKKKSFRIDIDKSNSEKKFITGRVSDLPMMQSKEDLFEHFTQNNVVAVGVQTHGSETSRFEIHAMAVEHFSCTDRSSEGACQLDLRNSWGNQGKYSRMLFGAGGERHPKLLVTPTDVSEGGWKMGWREGSWLSSNLSDNSLGAIYSITLDKTVNVTEFTKREDVRKVAVALAVQWITTSQGWSDELSQVLLSPSSSKNFWAHVNAQKEQADALGKVIDSSKHQLPSALNSDSLSECTSILKTGLESRVRVKFPDTEVYQDYYANSGFHFESGVLTAHPYILKDWQQVLTNPSEADLLGRNILHDLAQVDMHGHITKLILENVVEKEKDVTIKLLINQQDWQNETPLQNAIEYENIAVMHVLLDVKDERNIPVCDLKINQLPHTTLKQLVKIMEGNPELYEKMGKVLI